MKRKNLFLLIAGIIISSGLQAQIFNPVKWQFESKAMLNEYYELIFTATIDDTWSIYSQYLESDDGPLPTT
ncbi:MAG TPA: hypothetical protein VK590_10570, partial [Saprospiraceae bacterium]|nr:hypothetical protein [Saprospiraceae bacterium]